jgi:formylglycine-generating enzyme required for sulfatase activity
MRETAQRKLDEERQRLEAEARRFTQEREQREAALRLQEQQRQDEERQRLAAERERREAEAAAKTMSTGKVFKDCSDCPEMVVIPAGSFEMGGAFADEEPVHRVTLKGFALGRTEVTQGQWKSLMGNNPSKFSGFFSGCDDCPVEQVNWGMVKAFIQSLNAKTGKTYRLPSEAEWEYACRAGGTQTYCGGENVDSVAWYGGNSGSKTHAVAGKQPNAWGLYDMSGNVWEWAEDCWNRTYKGAPSDGSAWINGSCKWRVLRGGSWNNEPPNARSAERNQASAELGGHNLGFRPARMLP